MNRFIIETKITSDNKIYCQIIDNDAEKYNMQKQAVSLNLTENGASQITAILNNEWKNFLVKPS